MMWRPNSFVRYICIILMLFNCSASAEHANFGATTVNRAISDVPTASLYVINGNQDVEHVPNETKPSLSQHEDTFDSGHNENIDESSQQNAVNLVLLPKLAINNRKNRAENSETQPMVESQRHKRNSEAQDVCDTAECKCKSESKFLTVDCHFQHVSILFLILRSIGFCYSFICSLAPYRIIGCSYVPHCRTQYSYN